MINYTIIVVMAGSPCRKTIEGKSPADAIKRYVKHSWGSVYEAEPAFTPNTWSIFLGPQRYLVAQVTLLGAI